jgi:hypothetical protein
MTKPDHVTTKGTSIVRCLLALVLCIWATSPASSEEKSPSPFVGEWCNKDFASPGLTRVRIRQDGAKLIAHMWGRCHPTECDWGDANAAIEQDGKVLSVTWEKNFKTEVQTLTLLADGSLQLEAHTHFTDKSGRADHDSKYAFAKGLTHDWSDP